MGFLKIFPAAAFLAATLFAQTLPPPPGPWPPPTWTASPPNARSTTFEVATVKRSQSISIFGGGMEPGPGRLKLNNMSLEAILRAAYGFDILLEGLPAWARTERFDIDAKAYETPDLPHLLLALRPLLADRFGLVVHEETRVIPIFMLRVNGKASKLKAARGPKDPNASQLTASSRHLIGRHASMSQLARTIRYTVGRPVIDRTGLTGEYDFDANWLPEQYPGGVSIFTALKEQLGLRIESARGPAQVLVIDKLNRTPTDN